MSAGNTNAPSATLALRLARAGETVSGCRPNQSSASVVTPRAWASRRMTAFEENEAVGWHVLAVALLTSVLLACSESTTVVSDNTTCGGCRLELERIARLGSAADPASRGLFASVSRDSQGRFFVYPADRAGEILVYGPRGEFQQILGRTGSGPGEFSPRITRVEVGAGDTIFVLDRAQRRVTTYTSDLVWVSTDNLPFYPPEDIWYVGHGTFFIHGWGPPEAIGGVDERRSFHFYEVGTDSVRAAGPVWYGEVPQHYVPEVVTRPGAAGRFFTMRRRSLGLSLWDAGEEPARQLVREAPWFPADSALFQEFENPWTTRPIPYVQGITTDESGQLVVVIDVADDSWVPTGLATEAEPLLATNAHFSNIFDSLIEIVDPTAGGLVHRHRTDAALRVVRTRDSELLFYSLEVSDGVPVADVWRGRLINGPRQ